MVLGVRSLRRSLQGRCISLPFLVLETACIPWFMAPFANLRVSSEASPSLPLCFPHHITVLTGAHCLPLIRPLVIGPTG